MTLAIATSNRFSSRVRARGESYFRFGRVRFTETSPAHVSAVVRGTQTYRVELSLDGNVIGVSCTCPYFMPDGEPCKHIWATILAADAQGLMARVGSGGRRVSIEPFVDESLSEDVDKLDDFDELRADEWADAATGAGGGKEARRRGGGRRASRAGGAWQGQLRAVEQSMLQEISDRPGKSGRQREILCLVDVTQTQASGQLTIDLVERERRQDGQWGKTKALKLSRDKLGSVDDEELRRVLALVMGADSTGPYGSRPYYGGYEAGTSRYSLSGPLREAVIAPLCRTGRLGLRVSPEEAGFAAVAWDEGAAWEFRLRVRKDEAGRHWHVDGVLRRDGQEVALSEPVLLLAGGLVFWRDRAGPLEDHGAFGWIALLRQEGMVRVPVKKQEELIERLYSMPRLPALELPEELRLEEVRITPRPRLVVRPAEKRGWGTERLRGELSFLYEERQIEGTRPGRWIPDVSRRRCIVRDAEAEQAAMEQLVQVGFQRRPPSYYEPQEQLELAPRHLARVVRALVEGGWQVEAEGKLIRRPGEFRLGVVSGVDWFELHGVLEYDGQAVSLPELLAAVARGEKLVTLDDGSVGMLPEEWLKRYGVLAGLGRPQDDCLRFTRSQAGVLDALLAAQPEVDCDAVFEKARAELREFAGVKPKAAPKGFRGQLRPYQEEGLGWLEFLQKFGMGGCLADDMGLGKTVQVLALLEERREQGVGGGPSLVVVPKSLVFNWISEAARFTPKLRVLDYTGLGRHEQASRFKDHDLVITTYGVLRRDAARLKDMAFDYVVLDESQTIKNSESQSAKAARLLSGEHRLALSGTPVENHLGELWSLLEFLNPGMLGRASAFRGLVPSNGGGLDESAAELLGRALRPFILRRTKAQVASDLPEKLEQTLYCDLEPPQRKLYNELRDHYRASLLKRLDRDGIKRSKIQILEALLRLRQAACHPALIDKARVDQPSAKLELLLPQLAEVREEGHKALVFSQFTSMLAIVRERLDREGVTYEYLDGRTRQRAEKVDRFQNDPSCRLFLISLKAGGLGLNLTAAEYVFILDPWWNPAVEAQAIDRAHRIGQTRQVFAYRLIARDTVEEKIAELQERKRKLAESIIGADSSLIRDLKREDLELLLG